MLLKRYELAARDWFRFSKPSRSILSMILPLFARKVQLDPRSARKQIDLLTRAIRICPSGRRLRYLESILISQVDSLLTGEIDWQAFDNTTNDPKILKGIILKPPCGPKEKGVLLISFEDQWLRLFRHADFRKIAADYHVVLAPSWSPPHDFAFMAACKLWPGPVFHLLSNFNDKPLFQRLSPNAVAVPLLASSWVNPNTFDSSQPVTKDFDVVMLANFARYKRHFLLFEAMRKMRRDRRILLLGKSMEGRTADTILQEAALYGVQDRVVVREG